jgi:hypothetical protein
MAPRIGYRRDRQLNGIASNCRINHDGHGRLTLRRDGAWTQVDHNARGRRRRQVLVVAVPVPVTPTPSTSPIAIRIIRVRWLAVGIGLWVFRVCWIPGAEGLRIFTRIRANAC